MKKYFTISIALIMVLLLPITHTYSQWIQSNGPYGGNIQSLDNDGTNLFAGTKNGIYISTDSGSSWSLINNGLTNTNINTILCIDGKVYVGTDNGIFVTSNNGTNWTAINSGISTLKVYSIAVSGSHIYAGTNSGIYLSTNNGTSFSSINNGLLTDQINSILRIGNTIYIGTSKYGVYSSNDNGANWTAISFGLTNTNIYSLATDGNFIFVGTKGYVFKSSNNGVSWDKLSNSGIAQIPITKIILKNSSIYLSNGTTVISTNNGATWFKLYSVKGGPNSTGAYYTANTITYMNNNLIEGNSLGIYRTSDNNNWTKIDNGINGTSVYNFSKLNNNIYLNTNQQIHLSTNGGNNWEFVYTGVDKINSLAVFKNYLFCGVTTDGYPLVTQINYSTDNGIHWLSSSLAPNPILNIVSFFAQNSILYCLGSGIGGSVYLSPNNGQAWSILSSGSMTQTKSMLIVNNNIFIVGWNPSIMMTTVNGNTWQNRNNGIPTTTINKICQLGSNLFVGSSDAGVYYSSDLGLNWIAVNNGLHSNAQINYFEIKDNYLIVGTDKGVYITGNNGTTWKNLGMSDKSILSVFVDGDNVFVGTDGYGVWVRSFTEILTDIKFVYDIIPNTFSLSQNYPNPFNPTTKIEFSIPKESNVVLKIYDILGREITTLINKELPPASYSINFNASMLNNGIYFYRLQTEGFSHTKKMILLK